MSGEIINQEQLQREVMTWPERAKALAIRDAAGAQEAAAMLTCIKGLRKRIDETFDPVIKRAHEAHKAAVAAKKSVEAPLTEAESIIKRGLSAWQAEEDRRRREEEARLAAIARREEEERRLAEALHAEAMGEPDLAEAIISEPVVAPVVRVAPTPKINGVSFSQVWSAEVIDMAALVRFVAINPAMINLVQPNLTALNAMARAQKSALNIPGVRAVASRVVSGRSS